MTDRERLEQGRAEHGRDSYEHRRDDLGIVLALTPAEMAQLRKLLANSDRLERMLIAHDRAEWLWSTIGVWLKWIAAIGATMVAVKLLLSDFREILKGWLVK